MLPAVVSFVIGPAATDAIESGIGIRLPGSRPSGHTMTRPAIAHSDAVGIFSTDSLARTPGGIRMIGRILVMI
jgi:hypothetical protein